MATKVNLPDGTSVTVQSDDPTEAASAAHKYFLRKQQAEPVGSNTTAPLSAMQGKPVDINRGVSLGDRALSSNTAGTIGSFAQGIGDGASFGLSDELNGALFGRDARDQSRNATRSAFRDRPVAAFSGEVLGSIPPLLLAARTGAAVPALARVGQLLNTGGKVARATKTGAAFGGVLGATNAEGGLRERALGSIGGAIGGGTLGPLLQVGGSAGVKVGGKAISAISNILNKAHPSRQANMVAKALIKAGQDENVSPLDTKLALEKFASSGNPDDLLFEGSSVLRDIAKGVSAIRGRGQNKLAEVITERAKSTENRLANAFKSVFPEGAEPGKMLQKINTFFERESQPLYAKAYSEALNITPKLEHDLKGPMVKDAIKSLAEDIKQRAHDGNPMGDVEMAVRAMRRLRERATKLYRDGDTSAAETVKTAYKNLQQSIRDANPSYAQAELKYAGNAADRDAFELGLDVLNATGRTSNRKTTQMLKAFDPRDPSASQSERAHFMAGIVDASKDFIDAGAKPTAQLSRRLKRLFGADVSNELMASLNKEAIRTASEKSVGHIPTSARAAAKSVEESFISDRAKFTAAAAKSSILDFVTAGAPRRAVSRAVRRADKSAINMLDNVLSQRGGQPIPNDLMLALRQQSATHEPFLNPNFGLSLPGALGAAAEQRFNHTNR